jgi:hypothetical protein
VRGLGPRSRPSVSSARQAAPVDTFPDMKRFGLGLLYAIGGYFVAAVAGCFLIGQFSSNTHDRTVEAAMTSVFVFGPLGAVAAFIVGFIRCGRSAGGTNTDG